MKKNIYLTTLLLYITKSLLGQSPAAEAFSNNIVKIYDKTPSFDGDPRYGFITGVEPVSKTLYFILIYPRFKDNDKNKKMISDSVRFVFQKKGKEKTPLYSGYRIRSKDHMVIGSYELLLYEARASHQINKMSFSGMRSVNKEVYQCYIDVDEIETSLEPAIKSDPIDLRDEKVVKENQVKVILRRKDYPLGQSGMPLINTKGELKGVIAEEQKKQTFNVLDIASIRYKLKKLGGANECQYFSLIESGTKETPCDSLLRINRDNAEASAAEKKRQAKLTKKQLNNERADVNFPFAVSLGGGGYLESLNLDNQNSGKLKPGYTLGLNLHILPDKGALGLLINPKYMSSQLSSGSDYKNTTDPSYRFISADIKSWEVPILIQIVSRNYEGSEFIALGYAYGQQDIKKYSFSGSDGLVREQSLSSYPKNIHKAVAELGIERGKFRLATWGAYQISSKFNPNYQIIYNGSYLKPFQDVKKGNFSFGVEVAYRIWGHWRNGVRI